MGIKLPLYVVILNLPGVKVRQLSYCYILLIHSLSLHALCCTYCIWIMVVSGGLASCQQHVEVSLVTPALRFTWTLLQLCFLGLQARRYF